MALRLSTGLRNTLLGLNTNLIANGTFTSAVTSWTAGSATLTSAGSGYSGNCLSIEETGSSNPGTAYQDITTKVGHTYKLTLYFKKGTADGGKFYVGTTGAYNGIYTSRSLTDATWTQHVTAFVATATTTRLTLESTDATAGETSFFDNVECYCMSHSVQDIFNGGSIYIYSGTQPTEADDTIGTSTLLVTINNGGSGVTFDDAVAGTLTKKSTETWSGVCASTGTAGWFRLIPAGDLTTDNTTDCRIDGAISTSGSQLNMSSLSFTSGATQTISTFSLTLPTS